MFKFCSTIESRPVSEERMVTVAQRGVFDPPEQNGALTGIDSGAGAATATSQPGADGNGSCIAVAVTCASAETSDRSPVLGQMN